MVADERLDVIERLFQRRDCCRVARIAERNGDIAQIAAPLCAFDRVVFEFFVEFLWREREFFDEILFGLNG